MQSDFYVSNIFEIKMKSFFKNIWEMYEQTK